MNDIADKLENAFTNVHNRQVLTDQTVSVLTEVVSDKADKSDTYTKEEIEAPLRTISSEAEFARLTAQQNKTDIQTLREDIILTSEQIRNQDTAIRNLGEGKADKADTYTKIEVEMVIDEVKPMAMQAYHDAGMALGISVQNETAIAQLTENKADKTDTYTKTEVDDSIETNRLIASQAANDADAASSLAIQNQTAIEELKKEWVNIFECEVAEEDIYTIELTREEYPELFTAKRIFFDISLPKQTESLDIPGLYITDQKNNVIGAFWTTKRNLTISANNSWLVLERFNDATLFTVMPLQASGGIIANVMSSMSPRVTSVIDNATSLIIKNYDLAYPIPKGLKLIVRVEV